jgi:PAS domain S-box-containing protein
MPYQNIELHARLSYWNRCLSIAVIVIASLVLIGWQFDLDILKRPVAKLVAMNPLTAILFILSGISLLAIQNSKEKDEHSKLASILSLLILFSAVIKITGLLAGTDIYLDTFLYRSKLQLDVIGNISNTMAPNTALNFLLTGLALMMTNYTKANKQVFAQLVAAAILLLSILSLLGYLYKVNAFYGIVKYIPMAVHTAITFFILSLAILFSDPDKGIMKNFTSRHSGSTSARFMVPAAIILPVVLGYLRLLGDWNGIYSKEFGVAILILSIIIIFLILIWYNAASLNKKDALRTAAEEDLRVLNSSLEQKVEERSREIISNDKRFRAMIENSSEIIALADEQNNIQYINKAIEDISGYTSEEIRKLDRYSTIHPDDRAMAKDNFLAALRAPGKPVPASLRIIHRDGRRIWLEGTITNMLHDESIRAIVSNYRDVTERIEAEQKIVESEKKIWQTLDKMMEGIQIIDSDWKYVYVNESTARMGKYTREDLLGHTMMEKYPGIENSELFAVLKECMENKTSRFLENEFVYNDGTKGWFELSIQPVPEGLFILSIDITKRKAAENSIRKLNEELEDRVKARTLQLESVNKELESFSYSVSHDLRAPLRAINGYATMIEEDYAPLLDDEGKRLLGIVQYNAKRMGTLIDDLLAFSRLGRKEIQKTEINTGELVEAIISDINKTITHNAEIRTEKLSDVQGDYSLLTQVFYNLISNAVKYSSKKEKPVVTISSELKNNEVIFKISDNGAGFDMKYGHKLFGVFQRLHGNDEFDGTGVGLAIVQRVISKHNGRVWAEGIVGEGATFYFTLPLSK